MNVAAARGSVTAVLDGRKPLARSCRPSTTCAVLADVLNTLRDGWLEPVIRPQGVVRVTGAGEPDDRELGRIAAADAVRVRGDADGVARRFPGKRVLDAAAATLAALQGTSVSEPR